MNLRRSFFVIVFALGALFGPSLSKGLFLPMPVAAKAAQVGCSGGCDFETSFLTTNKNYDGSNTGTKTGWTADVFQSSSTGSCSNGTPGNLGLQQAGVAGFGSWTDANNACDGVITAANYSLGAGGKGYRRMRTVGGSGATSNGGGISITPATSITSGTVNVTWMERWSAGFNWNYPGHGPEPHYIKSIYMNASTSPFAICGYEGNGWGCNFNGVSTTATDSITWVGLMGGQNSDVQWHNHEVQLDLTNKRVWYWVDGVASVNGEVPPGAFSTWARFNTFAFHNQAYVGLDGYTDIDDIKVEYGLTAGDRIGSPTEIGGGGGGGGTGSNLPPVPNNIRIRLRVPGIGGLFSLPH